MHTYTYVYILKCIQIYVYTDFWDTTMHVPKTLLKYSSYFPKIVVFMKLQTKFSTPITTQYTRLSEFGNFKDIFVVSHKMQRA